MLEVAKRGDAATRMGEPASAFFGVDAAFERDGVAMWKC